jgi:hypothetical protein
MPGEIALRRLFNDTSTADAFLKQHQRARAAIAELPSEALLTAGVDALLDGVVAAHRIDPLMLHWDARTVDSAWSSRNPERAAAGPGIKGIVSTDSPMTAIVEFIPFSGAAGLFDMRPSDPPSDPMFGSVRQAGLALAWVGDQPDAASVRTHLDLQEANVRVWVTAVNRDVEKFNTDLRRAVRTAVKARFTVQRSTPDVLAALGLPLRQQGARHEASLHSQRRQPGLLEQDAYALLPRRGPGRPGWTRDVFEERWSEACRLTPAPHTYPGLAKHFRALDRAVGAVSGDHLGRLRRRFSDQGQ